MITIRSVLADTVALGALIGLFLPWFTSVVEQPTWPAPLRRGVAIAVSVIVGALTALAKGDISHGGTVLGTVLAVVLASSATYHEVWRPSGVSPAIEARTSPPVDGDTEPL